MQCLVACTFTVKALHYSLQVHSGMIVQLHPEAA